jgi:amino acid adenylation domain-containing protein
VDPVLLRLPVGRYSWYIGYHQLVADGAGIYLFVKRVIELYGLGLDAPDASFGSLAALIGEETAYRQSTERQQADRYFAERFPGRPAPTRVTGGAGRVYRGERRTTIELDSRRFGELQAAARVLGTKWFGLVAMALATHTARTCGVDSPVLSLVLTGRGTERARATPSRMSNVLPIRVDLTPELTWEQLASQVTASVDELRSHQRYRGEDLRGRVLAADSGNFFGPTLNYVPWNPRLRGGDLIATVTPIATITPTEDFAVYCYKTGKGGLEIVLDAHPERMTEDELQLHRGRLDTLLACLCDIVPGAPIATSDLITGAERRLLLQEWSGTTRELPEASLPQLLKTRCAATPDAVALESSAGQLTYAELDGRMDRLAARLAAQGVAPGSRVGVLMDRSADLVVTQLAIVRAGGAYVPLDPRNPAERLVALLRNAAVRVVVVDGRTHDHDAVRGLDVFRGDVDEPVDPPPHLPEDPLAPCYVMHTSGSTGQPKGVEVTHRNVAALGMDKAFATPAHRRVLFHSPHAFDASTYEIWVPLLNGGTVVVADGEVDSLLLREVIGSGRVTALWLTAGLFAALAEGDPACLRGAEEVWAGGEALSPEAVRRVARACPGTVIVNGYGPTETTTFATCHRISPADEAHDIPIGRPLDNTRAYVLDERLELVPPGAVGELYLGGAGVANGYVGRPDLTDERFLPDPFGCQGERVYATGDRVRWCPDGTLQYLGRADAQVKIHGFRIEPGEIENTLAGHPRVSRVAVTTVGPGGGPRLTAHVVAEPGQRPGPGELRNYLVQRLPEYMIPSSYLLVAELPLTTNGKVDRALLSRNAQAEAPPVDGPAVASAGEQLLCDLFGELLDDDQIRPDDNFFELGGHSLLATRLAGKLKKRFGVHVRVADVFDAPTPAMLVAKLGLDALLAAESEADDVDPSCVVEASSFQRRLWLTETFQAESGLYNVPLAWRTDGHLDPDRLEAALSRLVQRHETLRTRFAERDGTLYQVIDPPWQPRLSRLTAATSDDRSAFLRRECNRPFDLAAGGLLRAALIDEPIGGQLLLLTFHHIVFDEASLPIVLRELANLYADPAAELPEPRQYREFVTQQQVDAEALDWVVSGLQGAPCSLPSAEAAGPHGIVPVQVLADLLPRLRSVQAERGVSWLMLAATAVAAMLHRWSGLDDVTFGLPVANRDSDGLAEVVGPCMNTMVIRSRCPAGAALSTLVGQMRERVLGALAHQHAPFEQVVRALNPPRRFGAAPYLDVVLAPQIRSADGLRLGGVPLEQLSISEHTAAIGKFGLTVSVTVTGDRMSVALDYRGDHFDRRTVLDLAWLLRQAFTELVTEPDAPVQRTKPQAGGASVAELERRVAKLWQEVLGRGEIDVNRGFFDVGGDSLTLVALHGKLCTELNVCVPLQRLFEAGTIRGLAQVLAGQPPEPDTSVADRAELARRGRAGRP